MKLRDRIKALSDLGDAIRSEADWMSAPISIAYNENKWFTPENSRKAIKAIENQFLKDAVLSNWASQYQISEEGNVKNVGLVLAGNIPLVGFHDVLSTFVSGHKASIKCSSKDAILLEALIGKLTELHPEAAPYFEFVDRLKDFDAVIATGSNNSSRYFEQYFSHVPNIIRSNRNAVAVLDGTETDEELLAMGEDIFNYFGLGCRNVSKLYVPKDYKFDQMLGILHEGYKELANHNKYRNNLDYNNALFLLNKVEFLMSGSLIITASNDITSRIATLHYEHYMDRKTLEEHLKEVKNQIQCVVAKSSISGLECFRFGEAQNPSISDYADGVDTLAFLKSL